jgi:Zn-dependent oligopeptidase
LAVNVPLLDKALELRRKIAKLLGYPTWADYITEVKMIKTARGVTEVCFSPEFASALVD